VYVVTFERTVDPATGTPLSCSRRAHSSALRGPVSVVVVPVGTSVSTMFVPTIRYALVPAGQDASVVLVGALP
jgi:hypothetical protein